MSSNIHPIKQLIIISTLCLLCACSALKKYSDVSVEDLIKQGLYHQALSMVEKNSPEYAKIIHLIKDYQNSFPKKLADHITHQRWEKVIELLKEAEQRIPNSEMLIAAKEQWEKIQEQEQQRIEAIRLVSEAENMHKNLLLELEMLRVDPDNFAASWRKQRLTNAGRELAKKLLKIGLQALENDKLGLAKQTIPLAYQLNDSEPYKQANEKLQAEIAIEEQKAEARRLEYAKQQLKIKLERITAELNNHLDNNSLEHARELLKEAEEIDGDNEQVIALKNEIDNRVQKAIKGYLEEGILLYSQEDYDKAIESWNKILKLDPTNRQAFINIMRTEQVLENLKKLLNK